MLRRTQIVLLFLALIIAGRPVLTQRLGLQILVVQGEGAINSVQSGTGAAPIVEVRDLDGNPVANALVAFVVRSNNVRLNGTLLSTQATTDAAGRAAIEQLTPTGPGLVQIEIAAVSQGRTTTGMISQQNVETAAQALAAAERPATPQTRGDGPRAARPRPARGDSSLLSIAAGGAAVVAGAYVLSRDRSEVANVPAIRAEISGLNRVDGPIIQEVTEVTFFGTHGDRAATPTFSWNFGDGLSATGEVVTHIFAASGTFTVTVTSSVDNATASTSIQVASLSGYWGTPNKINGVTEQLQMVQQGRRLSGEWIVEIDPHSSYNQTPNPVVSITPLDGTIAHPRNVQLQQLGECQRALAGAVTSDLNFIIGAGGYGVSTCGTEQPSWTFRR